MRETRLDLFDSLPEVARRRVGPSALGRLRRAMAPREPQWKLQLGGADAASPVVAAMGRPIQPGLSSSRFGTLDFASKGGSETKSAKTNPRNNPTVPVDTGFCAPP